VRHTPELIFQYDEGLDATDRVARLLEETKRAPDAEEE
jgi:ribosome-binding factor A